ncbi:hypothetical protein DSUL_20508 [Desulfovibrionales bacterium]
MFFSFMQRDIARQVGRGGGKELFFEEKLSDVFLPTILSM